MPTDPDTTVEIHRVTTRALLEALKKARRVQEEQKEAAPAKVITIFGEFAP